MTSGKVKAIISNLLIVEVDGPIIQNEICYIVSEDARLMAEVIKADGRNAYIQVFESTRMLRSGLPVEFTGHMLEATLGPGLLSGNYDGLLHNLNTMKGNFIQRGDYTPALDGNIVWNLKPLRMHGERVSGGDWLAEVTENSIIHKIMVPFGFTDLYELQWLAPEGSYKSTDTIAILADSKGNSHKLNMIQKWPVKKAISAYQEKLRPSILMETGIRTIDTLNPMAQGGTGFIPGPFGSGKTVLQQSIARQAEADIVIIAACGERANEVVDLFVEFPELDDPWTGRKLIERTIIIANTSNMPVAAREASVYTAMTLAEYYRAMGLKVLLLADSTSRWAQALREMSNRLEELPGPDAFPVDLPSIIANFNARAGLVRLNNGKEGAITFIGTVSPAGGNLKEPVTESTRKATRCFYGLSQQRADSKRYPAIDPIDSYSKYLEYPEFIQSIQATTGDQWFEKITLLKNILLKGKEAFEQINILGDDGVTIDLHISFWHSEVVDFVLLQQDAFDPIDSRTPIQRQKYMVDHVLEMMESKLHFFSFDEVQPFFKKIIDRYKQMNYVEFNSPQFMAYSKEIMDLVTTQKSVN